MIRRNLLGPYPPGIPTPLVAHQHPYPTRFHGGIWTRPVFAFPWVESPQAVFKPDDFAAPAPTSGLGTLLYQTGRGVFRPGGRGGGIFDGNLAGLGILTAKNPRVRSLGAAEIPWQCWDKPGFKDCHNSNYAVAQQRCGSADYRKTYGYDSAESCVADEVYYADKANCKCSEMATTTASTTKTDDEYWANLTVAQARLNELLKAQGYCPIKVDGKLGPGTCGAAKAVGARPPSACKSFTAPQKLSTGCGAGGGGGGGGSTLPDVAVEAPDRYPYTSADMGGGGGSKMLWFALAGAGAFGALYLWSKRKKKS